MNTPKRVFVILQNDAPVGVVVSDDPADAIAVKDKMAQDELSKIRSRIIVPANRHSLVSRWRMVEVDILQPERALAEPTPS